MFRVLGIYNFAPLPSSFADIIKGWSLKARVSEDILKWHCYSLSFSAEL